MIKNNELTLSVSEYLKKGKRKSIRGLVLITDKQSLFCCQANNDDFRTHDEMNIDMEMIIHPNSHLKGFSAIRKNNMIMASLGKEWIIYLPNNHQLSMSQYNFLEKALNETESVNKEDPEHKIKLLVLNGKTVYKGDNTNEALLKIKELITREISIEEERIIGTTLDHDNIIKNMAFHLDLENCNCTDDLIDVITLGDAYYSDSFYQKYLQELIDYPKFRAALVNIRKVSMENYELTDLTYSNIIDKLVDLHDNITNDVKTI